MTLGSYTTRHPFKPQRTVCWFSCGVTSAVATKLALERSPYPVTVAYCASTLSTEHPDNRRFLEDCEKWFGVSVTLLYAKDYEDTWDVWTKTRWLVGVGGARCTTELKKRVRQDFHDPEGDIQVFGFDAGEVNRVRRFREQNPEVNLWAPLVEEGITKAEALTILRQAGIEIPAMYRLGYKNNNCIGCVKGQSGYWNKIREDFPEHFAKMALLEREIGAAINKSYAGDGKRKRVFLDELPLDAGRYELEPDIQCGIWCDVDDNDSAS